MTYNRSLFKDYTEFDKSQKVVLRDGHLLDADGIGKFKVCTMVSRSKSATRTMHDVLHIPAMNVNLFSMRAAATHGIIVQSRYCEKKVQALRLCTTGLSSEIISS